MNHTPGPWKVVHYKKTKYVSENYEIQFGDDGECVAEIVHEEKDARLIAAAPDMLRMLVEIDIAFDGIHVFYGRKVLKDLIDRAKVIVPGEAK